MSQILSWTSSHPTSPPQANAKRNSWYKGEPGGRRNAVGQRLSNEAGDIQGQPSRVSQAREVKEAKRRWARGKKVPEWGNSNNTVAPVCFVRVSKGPGQNPIDVSPMVLAAHILFHVHWRACASTVWLSATHPHLKIYPFQSWSLNLICLSSSGVIYSGGIVDRPSHGIDHRKVWS